MSPTSLRVYFSDRLEQVRYACDVEVDLDSTEPLRIGRGPDNEVVLPGLQVPDLAATVRHEGGRWWLTGRDGVCRLDGRPLAAGESVAWSRGQELQVAHYTVEFEDYQDDQGPARVDRERLERAGFDLIDKVHQALLPRIPSEPCLDPRPEREKMLLELEHSIEEIAEPMLDEAPDVAEHLAGRCIRDELLRRRIDPGSSGPAWAMMMAVVPEIERSLRRVVEGFERLLGLEAEPNVEAQIALIETRFWDAWQTWAGRRLDDGPRRYLACRTVKREIKDLVLGLGPLEDLIRSASVNEVMVNDSNHIYVEHDHTLKRSGRRFLSDAVTQSIIERIVARVGRRIDKSQPMVDARLPDGSRVNAVIPPLAVNGPCITIRKFADRTLDLPRLVKKGSISESARQFLDASVRTRRNIIVSGGTGSGKTTLLNCLSDCVPPDERIITIEDVAELRLRNEHQVRLETRDKNLEGQGAYTIRDLVKNALRMRPDRLIVGECRGPEALDMLQAMNTGHDGSLTTIHANSPADVVHRLEVMVLMAADLPVASIHRQIASGVDLIVHVERRRERRVVSRISELAGYDRRNGSIRIRDLYVLDPKGDSLRPTGSLPSFIAELIEDAGLRLDIFYNEPGATESRRKPS